MSYRLTLLSRDLAERAPIPCADAGEVWNAWVGRKAPRAFGLVSLASEGEGAVPDRRAFQADPLLMTQAAAAVLGGAFSTLPMHGRFAGMLSVRMLPPRPSAAAPPKVEPRGAKADPSAPLVPSDILASLGNVEILELGFGRPVRAALFRLDARILPDLGTLTEGDFLAVAGGDRRVLEAFRGRVRRVAEVVEAGRKAEKDEGEAVRRLAVQQAEVKARADRDAAFPDVPLAGRARASLRHLDERTARIVARRLGLDGPVDSGHAIGVDLGVTRSRIGQLLARSVRTLDRLDGWPSRLLAQAASDLPATRDELAGMGWSRGLGMDAVAAHLHLAGMPARVVETTCGPVLGSITVGEWGRMRARVNRLVADSAYGSTREEFLAALPGIVGEAGRGYERFLLHEIGWSPDAGDGWLLALKGRQSMTALVREAMHRSDGTIGARDAVALVGAYAPGDTRHTSVREAIRLVGKAMTQAGERDGTAAGGEPTAPRM